MRYSLLDRFQGTLVGLSLGSKLSVQAAGLTSDLTSEVSQEVGWMQQSLLSPERWRPNSKPRTREVISSINPEALAAALTQSLIESQGFDRVHWGQVWQKWPDKLQQNSNSSLSFTADQPQALDSVENTATDRLASLSEAAIAAIPIALFFHDNPTQLQQQLQQVVELGLSWDSTQTLRDGVLAIGYAISLALNEQLHPPTLIPHILNKLGQETAFSQQLNQVQTLIEQKASLEITVDQLLKNSVPISVPEVICAHQHLWDSLPIALAFYCFVSTPDELSLSLRRAVHTGYLTQYTCTLSAALSGAYNSWRSFPSRWQLLAKQISAKSKTTSPEQHSELSSCPIDILQQATELFTVWSGVYNTTNRLAETNPMLVVTAPDVMELS